ncbi:MAG: hypothetical protein AABN95_16095 [Acidobacteriota bacterium]
MLILPKKMDEFMYVPPVYLIYCWKCDHVEVMQNGRASEGFASMHKKHKDETQRIQIRYMTEARAA